MKRPSRKLITLTAVTALAAAAGTALFRKFRGSVNGDREAGEGVAVRKGEGRVRSAGPEGMRSETARPWTAADEASDESFPASDPPSLNRD